MRIYCLLLFLALTAAPAAAQVDAKLNLGSAVFGGISVAADVGLTEQSSVAVGLAYATNNFGIEEFRYTNLRVVPEYRYYFSPRRGADRFFVGGYGKVARITAREKADDNRVNATRTALGVLVGGKWVTEGGFLFEVNAGAGRALTFGGGGGAADSAYARAIGAITAFDVRLGLLVGYRF